jgi:hypothetical protein
MHDVHHKVWLRDSPHCHKYLFPTAEAIQLLQEIEADDRGLSLNLTQATLCVYEAVKRKYKEAFQCAKLSSTGSGRSKTMDFGTPRMGRTQVENILWPLSRALQEIQPRGT